jgi:catechol 2,3-dioxygenase-like lactoylglutathione lyase family enzyme
MLQQEKLVAFLATADPAAARAFYEGRLGLTLSSENDHLMHFESGPSGLALQKSHEKVVPRVGTALGWTVGDLRASVRALGERGVVFERYEGMQQDDQRIWSPAPGFGVAWFLDPDGNTLSLSGPC